MRGVAACVGLACAFLLGELLVRVAAPQESAFTGHGMYRIDPDLGYRLKPGHLHGLVRINSQGLRDVERKKVKPAGKRRVLVLGDSFSFGSNIPLEDNFPRQLERELGPDFEVVNSGTPGYSTRQEATWLEKEGLSYAPDVIVIAFFVGNDLYENASKQKFTVVEGEIVDEAFFQRSQRSWFRQLRNRSHLYRLLKTLPDRLSDAWSGDSFQARLFHKIERDRLQICLRKPPPFVAEGWRVAKQELQRIQALAAPRPIILLAIPDEFQVDPKLLNAVCKRYKLDAADYDLTAPQRRLAQLCKELGLTQVDPLDDFRQRTAGGERLYLKYDTHWNKEGNARIALALKEAVLASLK